MAFVFNDAQRRMLPQIIQALQRFEEYPEQLERERNQLHNDLPPPYSLSGETTQPPSPNLPVLSESDRRRQRRFDCLRSVPREQFRSQTMRERKRILIQIREEGRGRREAVVVDQDLDFLANAENNVRDHWVEQGIWLREWGPAWPKGTKLYGGHARPKGPQPGRYWGHEKEYERERERKRERERERKSELNLRQKYNIFSGLHTPKAEEPEPAVEELVAPPEHDTSASRPYYQFLYQISKEREWIIDEFQSRRSTRPVDIEPAAYESVRNNWTEDKIWNPKWGELPGMTWMHEDLYEEEENEVLDRFASPVDEPLPDAVEERRFSPPLPRLFDPSPMPDHSGDDLPLAPDRAEGSVVESTRSTKRKPTGCLAEVLRGKQAPEEPAGRILRGLRSSKVGKKVNPSSTKMKSRVREQHNRSSRPESSNLKEDGTLFKTGNDDGRPLSTAARKSRRKPRRKPILGTAKASPPPLRRSARIAAMNAKSEGRPSGQLRSSTSNKKSSQSRRR